MSRFEEFFMGRAGDVLLAALMVLQVFFIGTVDDVFTRVLNAVVIIFSSSALTMRIIVRQRRRLLERLDQQPVSFTQDDEGHWTALMRAPNGDPLVISLPDEVVEQGPVAVAVYITEQVVQR